MSDTNFQEELAQYLSKLRGLIPVGTPWWGFDAKAKPFGVQLYQGQYLSRDLYKVHFEYIQKYRTIVTDSEWQAYADSHNGMCPYFSYGDNLSTYRMPRINNVHPKFSDSYIGVGDYIPAGMPNITATWTWMTTESAANWATYPCLGAAGFDNVNYTKGLDSAKYVSSTSAGRDMTFDASNSNPIYGASNTVQPPAINMIIGEYVISGLSEFSLTTSEMLQERIDQLDEKVTKNVVESYNSDSYWYRKYSDEWIEQGGYYTGTASYGVSTTITFPIAFKNTPKYVHAYYPLGSYDNYWFTNTSDGVVQAAVSDIACSVYTVSNTSFTVQAYSSKWWYACGY